MAIMVYFKDQVGNELPFSGMGFAWCGAWAPNAHKKARTQIEVVRGKKRYMLTSDSFGGSIVKVKVWAPGGGAEYFDLVPGPVHPVDMPTEWVGRAAA